MKSKRPKVRLLGKQVWCLECLNKTPPLILRADHLIPARLTPYAMNAEAEIDLRVYGICSSCLPSANRFQQSNASIVDVNNPHIVIIKP